MALQERTEPKFMQFGEGETVEGILRTIERIQIEDKNKPGVKKTATRYTVEVGKGEFVSFLGCYQLDTKLHVEDKGHMVQVRYEGEDSGVKRNGNAMKRFKVMVDDQPFQTGKALEDGTYISDDDIGF